MTAFAALARWFRVAFALLIPIVPLTGHAAPPGRGIALVAPHGGGTPYQGYDLDGRHHHLGERDGTRFVVVAFLSTECPISNASLPALNQLAVSHRKKGVEVYGVVSSATATRAQAIQHHGEYKLQFPVLFDASADLQRALKPTHTPHMFLLASDGRALYDGPVDNRYTAIGRKKLEATVLHLQDALSAALAGRAISTPHVDPVGCLTEEPPVENAASSVTYARDVAPILFGRCLSCHQEGEAAPFPLVTYEDACRHANQIVEVTQSRLMPPWRAKEGYGHFKDERRLSQLEIDRLAAWVAAGKPLGNRDDLPPAPKSAREWKLGKPDMILKMREAFPVPASGRDLHQHFVIPINVSETRLISGVEFRPGNPRVVHHACFYLDTTGTARKLDQADPGVGYGGDGGAGFIPFSTLRSWLPGQTPRRLPDGSGRVLAKGCDLLLELHYQCSGKAETDQSTVAIYFAPKRARQLVGELQIVNCALEIPAGAARHHHTASYTLPNDATLLDCAPHMHLLGREVRARAVQPDGTIVPLIWIEDWNFNWQEQYEFHEPVRLPKGTRLEVDYWFDNSAGNRLNPNSPPKTVYWGEQTRDEMAICHFQFTCDRLEDYVALSKHYAAEMNAHRQAVRLGPARPAASSSTLHPSAANAPTLKK